MRFIIFVVVLLLCVSCSKPGKFYLNGCWVREIHTATRGVQKSTLCFLNDSTLTIDSTIYKYITKDSHYVAQDSLIIITTGRPIVNMYKIISYSEQELIMEELNSAWYTQDPSDHFIVTFKRSKEQATAN
ncbi:MAG: hypothetical protein IAF38_10480 [Bacteroidia bacterium]|nr:hypothetical protein [Bacteroidia bacterium]